MIGSDGKSHNFKEDNRVLTTCGAGCCMNKVSHVIIYTIEPFFVCKKCSKTYFFMPIKTLKEFKKDNE